MGINKTQHADTLWGGEGGCWILLSTRAPFHKRGSDPLRITENRSGWRTLTKMISPHTAPTSLSPNTEVSNSWLPKLQPSPSGSAQKRRFSPGMMGCLGTRGTMKRSKWKIYISSWCILSLCFCLWAAWCQQRGQRSRGLASTQASPFTITEKSTVRDSSQSVIPITGWSTAREGDHLTLGGEQEVER